MTEKFIASGVYNEEGRTRSKNNSDSATQYEAQNTAAAAKRTSMTNCGNKGLMRQDAHRNKIMIIAGQHGRDTATFMKLHDTHDYTIQAILKPNSSVGVLIETALDSTETSTKQDIVLLWTDEMSSNIGSKFIPNRRMQTI
ncbi:hypothetical protein JTB14_017091 [Gonioctena quinquepunctata]|nr:hypothetical protein JTB14_017091 [Gonioctena quinquepunctata]